MINVIALFYNVEKPVSLCEQYYDPNLACF